MKIRLTLFVLGIVSAFWLASLSQAATGQLSCYVLSKDGQACPAGAVSKPLCPKPVSSAPIPVNVNCPTQCCVPGPVPVPPQPPMCTELKPGTACPATLKKICDGTGSCKLYCCLDAKPLPPKANPASLRKP